MSAEWIVVLAALGAVGGFLAGLLGFGGGVLIFPLLYYVPPVLGLERFPAQSVAAIVISQVFFSALIGGLVHLRQGHMHRRLATIAGGLSAIGSLIGGVASGWATEHSLLLLFGIVTLAVSLLLFLPGPKTDDDDLHAANAIDVPAAPLAFCSLIAGVFIGFLGAGNFAFVPLLIYVFKVPTRTAIGSTLFIALINTATGFGGKLVTGQIPLSAIPVIAGAALGAIAGEQVHRLASSRLLRVIYAMMVLVVTLRVWLTILGFAS
jgi:uncharacterized membrane protein YfcA